MPAGGVPRPFGVHVEIGRQGHGDKGYRESPVRAGWLQCPAVGNAFLVITYVFGVAMFAMGLFLIGRRDFPAWMKGVWLWPLARVTPRVTHLQGWAALAVGTSVMAMGLGALLQNTTGGILVAVGIACYLLGAVLFVYSTFLSRRAAG